MENTKNNIGRAVFAFDGYDEKEGQILTETTDQFGTFYMVAFEDGTIDNAVTKYSVKEKRNYNTIGYYFK
jgi:hypothetical protein